MTASLISERFAACAGGLCRLWNYCTRDAPLGHIWCRDSDFRNG